MSDNHNLFQAFFRQFLENRQPENHSPADRNRTAIRTLAGTGPSYRYRDLYEESGRWANFLTAEGLKPGDRVSVQIDKCSQGITLYLGCLRAGLVYHPLNTAYQYGELEYFIDNAQPTAVVYSAPYANNLHRLAESRGINCRLLLGPEHSVDLHSYEPAFKTVPTDAGDIAALLYSSGTTGRPKGIMLSHANLAANARALVAAWAFSDTDILLHALPMFHVHGLFVALGCALMSGAQLVYLPKFDVDQVLKELPAATVMMGVPTYYTRLLAEPRLSRALCRNMRLFVSGSAPLLAETFKAFEARTGHTILERYGMTETNMNTSNPLHGKRKPGSVGLPLPGVEVRIAGPDRQPLAAGEVGDLQVRGPNVFKGYWQMPEKTREDFTADGFFNTGDIGVIDTDGYISIVGRSKDMIISGGLNVYPKEVETVLDSLAAIRESAVIGVPHADFGEAVVAVVVPQAAGAVDEQAVLAAIKGQLANFKQPKRVITVTELPRNTMGKIQKNQLRENYRALF
ncbi:AMP-binding protein [Exilibacterium tricleocarpae]|uniref:AMP-binding protein n=1 Tax=Exilibacterium tricleocarpae TaxID=2591008 RepID=A0A545U9G6_9GAMM|nr:AMP-binding protein [Exilibacterium tricleocarpae]TQV86053.1 AMP-binding protein [Exilibacterium tricleocarpae]